MDKIHYLKERIADLEVEIKETNDLKQAGIEVLNKELDKKMLESIARETEVKQLVEFKAELIRVNLSNEAKLKYLEKNQY